MFRKRYLLKHSVIYSGEGTYKITFTKIDGNILDHKNGRTVKDRDLITFIA